MKKYDQVQILLLATFIFIAGACSNTDEKKVTIKMDWEKQTISIDANKQPLSEVINQLQIQEGIFVQVEGFEEKEITVSIKNQPLDVALIQLLGIDKRYVLNIGQRELTIEGIGGSKKGKKSISREGLKPKYDIKDTASIKPDEKPRDNIKQEIDDIKQVESFGKNNTKEASANLKTSDDSIIRKKEKMSTLSQKDSKFIRLRFKMTDKGIKIEKALVLSGELIAPILDVTDYIYSVELNGEIISVGSFQDPLTMHSYEPDPAKEHGVLTGKEGFFNISLPDKVVNPDRIKSLVIQFYEVDNSISVSTIDIKRFNEVEKKLKLISRNVLADEKFPIENLSRK